MPQEVGRDVVGVAILLGDANGADAGLVTVVSPDVREKVGSVKVSLVAIWALVC